MATLLLGLLTLCALAVGEAPAAGEASAGAAAAPAPAPARDLFEAWRLAQKALATSPDEAAKVYDAFAQAHQESPEAAHARVLRGIICWRDLKDMKAAEKDFAQAAAAAGDGLAAQHAVRLGRRWLARVRMTRLARACHSFYIDHVEYPGKLAQLVDAKLANAADLADPWGDAFVYEAKEAALFLGIARQAYTLRSKNMDQDASMTAAMLAETKTAGKDVTLKATTPDEPRKVMVSVKGETLMIELGKTQSGLTAVAIEDGRVLLCGADYAVVLTR